MLCRHRIARTLLSAIAVLSVLAATSTAAAETRSHPAGRGPRILSPADRVIRPESLTIVTEPGPAGHLFTEVELWRVEDGQLASKVWQARVETGDLTRSTLDSGRFEPGVEGLAPWERYAIRARHGTTEGVSDWGLKRLIRTDDGSEQVFSAAAIGDVWLQIPATSWGPIDEEALTACEFHPRAYHPGSIRIGGVDFPGSGLSVKGGCGSSRRLHGKAAFKANMSWDDPTVAGCAETRRFQGLKKLTFNNQVQDASFTHERIGHDFLRRLGVPVPRVAPIRLHVNGELWGLYLHVETVDRRFLSRRFDSNDGMLYEAIYGCDLGEEACFEEKFDTDACDAPRAGDITTIHPLRSLHGRLAQLPVGNIYPRIRQIVDFDTYLTMWAAATVMGFFDGYPYNLNNYRVYHDPSNDRWSLIPTGLDQVFERKVDPFDPAGMLSVRCLAEADCEAAFRARLNEVIDVFEAADYPAMARAIARQVRAEVEADPRKEISLAEWRAAVENTVRYMRERPRELRQLLARTPPPEKAKPKEYFSLQALTDPRGKRFVAIRWFLPGADTAAAQQWVVAQGYFEQLEATMDAYSLPGASAEGIKSGTISVSYQDCQTAMVIYKPDDAGRNWRTRTTPIDPSIWKYCPVGG